MRVRRPASSHQVNKNADDYSCLRLKQTQAQAAMQVWHCARPSSTESIWCKRDQLLKKLRVLSLVCRSGLQPKASIAHRVQACRPHV